MQAKTARMGVLLVDDEEAVLEGLRLTVRRLGYDVHVATSARRASQVLAERPIAVVVSDERMPGISGTAFLAQLARERPDIVRIVLSGGGLAVAQRAVNDASAFRFLRKPCTPADLTKALADAVAQYAATPTGASKPPATGPSVPPRGGPSAPPGSIKRTTSGAYVLELDESYELDAIDVDFDPTGTG